MPKTTEFSRYLPIGPQERQWELFVTGAGYAEIPPASVYPHRNRLRPASHEHSWAKGRVFHEFAIVYVHQGQGEFESEASGRLEVEAGQALLLFPDVWHRYRPLKNVGWHEYWITFDGEYVRRIEKNGVIAADNPRLNPGLSKSVMRMFQDVVERLRCETLGFQHLAAAETLMILATMLAAEKQESVSGDVRRTILRAKAAIEARTEDSIVVEELAESLNLSVSHFREIFKRHTGLSPYQYHLDLKIGRAKLLLRTGDFSIKQIADSLGFRNVFHFMKLFKNKTGATASQWRSGLPKTQPKRRKTAIDMK
jgi:AraC-like DNA-binding protein